MAPTRRTHNFNIRLDDTEHHMLVALADGEGLTASDLVRQFVRKSYAAKFGEVPPKRTSKPKR